MAQNVLNFFYDSLYFTPIELPEEAYDKKERTETQIEVVEQPSLPIASKQNPRIRLYPNPTQNIVNVEYANLPENSKLSVVNILGTAMESQMLGGSGRIELNTTSYVNGVYLARIESCGNSQLKSKFIILK